MKYLQIVALIVFLAAMTAAVGCGEDDASENDQNDAVNQANDANDGNDGNDSNDGNDGNDANDGLSRYDDIDDEGLVGALLGEAICESAFECSENHAEAAQMLETIGRFTSKDECIDYFADEAQELELSAEEIASLEEGRLVLDRAHLADCRDTLLDDSCQTGVFAGTVSEDHPCNDLLQGQLQEGDHCNSANECSGELRCNSSDQEDTCYGECYEPDDSEPSCGDETCSDDEYCDYSDAADPMCQPLGEEDDNCSYSSDCDHGLWCSDDGLCTVITVHDEGENCQSGSDWCEAGTSCQGEDAGNDQPGECQPVGGENDSCDIETDCHYLLACDGGECISPEFGDPCDRDEQCSDGFCDSETDECTALYANGEECTLHSSCESGNCETDPDDPTIRECAADEVCELPDSDSGE